MRRAWNSLRGQGGLRAGPGEPQGLDLPPGGHAVLLTAGGCRASTRDRWLPVRGGCRGPHHTWDWTAKAPEMPGRGEAPGGQRPQTRLASGEVLRRAATRAVPPATADPRLGWRSRLLPCSGILTVPRPRAQVGVTRTVPTHPRTWSGASTPAVCGRGPLGPRTPGVGGAERGPGGTVAGRRADETPVWAPPGRAARQDGPPSPCSLPSPGSEPGPRDPTILSLRTISGSFHRPGREPSLPAGGSTSGSLSRCNSCRNPRAWKSPGEWASARTHPLRPSPPWRQLPRRAAPWARGLVRTEHSHLPRSLHTSRARLVCEPGSVS